MASFGRRARPWALPVLTLVGLGALAVVLLRAGYPGMFNQFQIYDDEGYLLISLEGHLSGAPLYDEVFTQYGPFYYLVTGSALRLFGLEISHDTGRLFTLAIWLAAAVLIGLAVYGFTRGGLLALAAEIMAFGSISTVANEPMHPGALLNLLVGTILAVTALVVPRRPRAGFALVGGLSAGAALTKVNVGGFALAALAFAIVMALPRGRRGLARAAATLLLVAVPLAITASRIDESWVQAYAVFVALSALAVAVAAQPGEDREEVRTAAVWGLGGAVAVTLVVSIATLMGGTSVGGLLRGVLLDPLQHPDAFSIPFDVPVVAIAWAAANAVAAGMAAWMALRAGRPGRGRPPWIGGAGRILAGLAMWVSASSATLTPAGPIGLGIPLAWVVAVPPFGASSRIPSFARSFLPALTVLQALHAYPVAGSQRAWAGLLLIPLGAIAIADGVGALPLGERRTRRARAWARGAIASAIVTGFALWLWNSSLGPTLESARRTYDDNVPLTLPGSTRMRLPSDQVSTLTAVTQRLDRACETYVSLPGMNSFYFFARREPPTWTNATGWTFLFEERRQEEVVERLRGVEGLCLLENQGIQEFWEQGRQSPTRPLLTFVRDDAFRTMDEINGYRIARRRPTP